MSKFLGIALLFLLSSAGFAQESTEKPPADAATSASEMADSVDDVAAEPDFIDDPELDEQTYEEDEDVFVPSEEIPSDEPIPFPTNI